MALRSDRRRRRARSRRTTRSLNRSLVALFCLALAVRPAAAHVRPGNFWTAAQAESIRALRGTRLDNRRCNGVGSPRVVDKRRLFRHFDCAATAAPSFAPARTVSVTYRLHALGKYRARRAPYTATNVRFLAFGVP